MKFSLRELLREAFKRLGDEPTDTPEPKPRTDEDRERMRRLVREELERRKAVKEASGG